MHRAKLFLIFTCILCTVNFHIFPKQNKQTQSLRMSDDELKKASRSPEKAAKSVLAQMSLREKLGQMLMIDMRLWGKDGSGTAQQHPVTKMVKEHGRLIRQYSLGAVILFRENLVDSKQIIHLINDLQSQSPRLPLFIGVDQEGGYVTRLQHGTQFSGNMALAATRSTSLAKKVGQVHGLELSALGINVNFSPVIDVNSNQNNPVIGVRSYSDNLELVNRMAENYIAGLERFPIMATVKHFPGHGNVSVDSHYGMPVVNDSEEDWRRIHLKPFTHSIKKGIRAVMTAHVALPALDAGKLQDKNGAQVPIPATLSYQILTQILRKEQKFQSLIFTDALDMGAISDHFTPFEAARRAILAGADVLTMPILIRTPHDVLRFEELFRQLENSASRNEELAARIDESAYRILLEKFRLGLSWKEPDPSKAKEIVASKEHLELEEHIARNAITVLENNDILPIQLGKKQSVLLLNTDQARNQLIRDELKEMLKKLKNVSMNITSRVVDYHTQMSDALLEDIEKSDIILMCTENLSQRPQLGQQIIDSAAKMDKKLVVIASRNPYDIAYLDNVDAYVVIYGMTGYDVTNAGRNVLEVNIRAGLHTIFTHPKFSKNFNKPKGQLPVNILTPGLEELLYPYGYGLRY